MKNRKFWNITNSEDNKIAEVKIYGEIVNFPCWEGDVSANSFENELKNFPDAEKIIVRINSPGGDVFEAQAIYNILKNHPAKVEVRIDALAASAATIIASAGDEIIMPDNALYMIHNPLSWASGFSRDMRKQADLLDTVKETIVNVYMSKVLIDSAEVSTLMEEETWMTATEAKNKGFITEILTSKAKTEAVEEIENFMRGSVMATFGSIPTGKFKNLLEGKRKINKNINNKTIKKEVGNMDIKDLQEKHPELYNEVMNKGTETARNKAITEERERVATLSNLKNIPGAAEIVEEAIKNGLSVAECTTNIANSESIKNIGQARVEKEEIKEDIKNSGASEVVPTNSLTEDEEKEEKIKEDTTILANLMKNKTGGR